MEITTHTQVQELPLVGNALTKAFNNLGVFTVSDLLYSFPTRYMDYRKASTIAAAEEGETVTITGRIKSIRANLGFRGRMPYTDATIEDGTGTMKVIWFNQTYLAKQLKAGDELILSGKISRYKNLQLSNPAYELLREDAELDDSGNPINIHTGRLVPVYRRSDIIPLRTMRRLVKLCLPAAKELEDLLTAPEVKKHSLLPLTEAIEQLHFPASPEQVTEARFRIAVDDVLPQQMAARLHREQAAKNKGAKIAVDIEKVKAFLKTLPFTLTASQKRAAWDIFQDLESGKLMNRLLQGDVGSGKTVVAILAALQTAGNGKQTVVLAPTEILAKQHYDTFGQVIGSKSGIALLTRTFANTDGKELKKAELLEKLENGEVSICIGTHALLQEQINFKNLALVVIDEQHRFGVSQRGWLLNGGAKAKENKAKLKRTSTATPHLLSMSATPIPRTLAMSLYADLAVSTLSQVPTGRKPVQTEVVPEARREEAYAFIRREAGEGRQAFIVTPRVEESGSSAETAEVRSVKKEFARLQKEVFPNLRVGLLYGKMKGADKEKVLADFANGDLDILVSTSVIEIGIDVPNATAMIIEGSERFGLAQLHQLRGRIGRNNYNCRCFLFTTEASQQDTRRLNYLTKTTDGFALAELDLEERGFGDLFGKQQSGFVFRFPQFISTKALLVAKEVANESLSQKLRELAKEYLTQISQD